MLKQRYRCRAALLLLGIIGSCTDPVADKPLAEDETPVQLNGMFTRALGDADDPGDGQLVTTGHPLEAYKNGDIKFYLSSKTTDAPPLNHFINSKITIGDPNLTDEGRNKLNGNVYYPLGRKEIDLYAHTVKAEANGNITLKSGTALADDVLSGRGTEADGVTPKRGNSADPVEFITFKHLMTRVDVKIEVDSTVEEAKPQIVTMKFPKSGPNGRIVDRGTYNIFSGGNATNNVSGDYAFTALSATVQTHYLVPNGANLSASNVTQVLSYLKIDDYVATPADLAAIKFPQTDKGEDFILNPGLAYDLVFKINRQNIKEIQLNLKEWNLKKGASEWGCEPKSMTLSMDSAYRVNEENKISKMVLKYEHSNGEVYQYTGQGKLDGGVNKIDFVTLPDDLSAGTLTADLYTRDGLLANNVGVGTSGASTLLLNLGKYGMRKNGSVLEISTPLQFALMLNDAGKTAAHYALDNDLDMEGCPIGITPTQFPVSSVFDGKGHDIIHLHISGNGLFTENNGLLKNFRIASGLLEGSGTGAIGAVCGINNGVIEAVVNRADIQPAPEQTAGGICGINGISGTVLATVNTGNILHGRTVGGITGENSNGSAGAVKACLNAGMLYKDANSLGGIAGMSINNPSVVQTCYWLSGTARKTQTQSKEPAIGNCNPGEADTESADLAASSIRGAGVTGKLNAVSSPWEFKMSENKSSWPVAIEPEP